MKPSSNMAYRRITGRALSCIKIESENSIKKSRIIHYKNKELTKTKIKK
jgi:hypothetical protein